MTRSAAVADTYAPIRVGTDIAFLGGIINYLLSNDKIHHEYVRFNTDATFLTKPEFAFDNGYFSGYDEARRSYNKATWGYQVGEDGFVKVDEMCRTSVDGVWAVGDLVATPALAHVGFAEAIVAIKDILGESPVPVAYDRVPWCIYCSPEVAFAGLSEQAAKDAGYDV